MGKYSANITVPNATHQLVKTVAEARGVSQAELIKRLIEDTGVGNPDVVPVTFQVPRSVIEGGQLATLQWLTKRVPEAALALVAKTGK